MIRSMTAFARQEAQADWGTLTCEIRTVNHRYLEPSFRLPDVLRELENGFREQLRKRLGRGKVDVGMRLQPAGQSDAAVPEISEERLAALKAALDRVRQTVDDTAPVDPLDVLRWPGVMATAEPDLEPVKAAAGQLFERTIVDLIAAREREGERLRPLFDQRLQEMSAGVARVRASMPEILAAQEAHLRGRFRAAQIDVDSERLAQEMVILAQKCDVAEELDRLEAHISEVDETLLRDEAIGRRLDFLMQELNREANTLSSKSIDASVTRTAVDFKVLIEQMREQVQNVE